MSQLDIELEVVRNRLAYLEKQKQIEVEKEMEKQTRPLKVLEGIIYDKKESLTRSVAEIQMKMGGRFDARTYTRDVLIMVELMFNMLKSIEQRLEALEPKN
jgi:hypothetical protein